MASPSLPPSSAKRKPPIRTLKVLLWVGALAPLALLGYELLFSFVVDPVELIQHRTGTTALILLFITLANTPIRRITGLNWMVKFRRPIGLFAFLYSTLHAFSYFVFDHSLNISEIWEDVVEHPWVLVGFLAFLLLIPLAVTSTGGWIRRMGGKRWNVLHKLVYPIALLGVLHFYWLVKVDAVEPIIYASILGALLVLRFVFRKAS
ncbi:MAG: sulfoxide reductase heme-binding subunit YedZ [Rhodothermales bacterium]|jgi:methionine sulfoxide reductase heme-binding subunit|nr:sulfoxide reductase heme-binding subunit YedZ [Rhodothermales bacterium]MDG2015727.1 sulfoxide reductase heme-binding subunit YedZ [Rhodothermales bacterium]